MGVSGRRNIPGLVTGLGLGLLALGPGLRRGFLLSYDMVFVPREPFAAAMPGLAPPRAVPSDLVIAAASRVLPADIVQKLVLLAIFVLGCAGVAALLDREPLLARLAGGVFYVWNPYVAERLIIGQWALLLGYAGPALGAAGGAEPGRGAVALDRAIVPVAGARGDRRVRRDGDHRPGPGPRRALHQERAPRGHRARRAGRGQPAVAHPVAAAPGVRGPRREWPRSPRGPTRRSAASAAC